MTEHNTRPDNFSLLELISQKRELVEKHLKRYDVDSNGCWIWNGPTRLAGNQQKPSFRYGAASFKIGKISKRISSHRLSFAYFNQKEIGSLFVCHKCDVPLCMNPEHLFLGTAKDNMVDAINKGRLADQQGSNNAASKLSDADVMLIVNLLPRLNNKQIARHFDNRVTHAAVSLIRLGKSWSHLTGIKPVDKRRKLKDAA